MANCEANVNTRLEEGKIWLLILKKRAAETS
jgi:hypothetical protein